MGEDEECSSAPSRRGENAENGKSGAALDPEREKRYAELFEQLDLNKDGRVDINELKTGLATRGLQLREAEKVTEEPTQSSESNGDTRSQVKLDDDLLVHYCI
ncbi:calcium-binding mitochondrial carrier protein SCaMC-1-like [Pundamilia nyererei]|uniref:Calcium-binding mitochondrial carrier protein SCaMC-1-like n=1 Tax=Pundamilia nyererei TaxID=303518 RepID=A0A9Y3RMD0_9CICH|nr:PREDICTED: calcium-binding mitochondrial carrier protein SCaMC-1-like [Pundamilia nyererei]